MKQLNLITISFFLSFFRKQQCKELSISEKNRINTRLLEEEIFYHQVSKVNCSDELNKSDDELISNDINELSSNKSTSNESNSVDATESVYKMPCESQVNEILNEKMNKSVKDKSNKIDTFTKSINVSNISRRRIIANMDYDVDTQFMCSTLLKEEDKSNLKSKFDVDVCDSSESKEFEHNGQKMIKLASDFKQDNLQLVDNRFFKSKKNNEKSSSNKTSTLLINKSSKNTNRLDQDEPIYDPRKPFSDLSSIEEAKQDYMNNLKNSQFNSINKRNSQYLNQFKNAKFDSIDRNSKTNDLKYRKMHNYFNDNQNYPSDYYDEDAWFCKTKLYEDHLDEIIEKWSYLDNEVWGKLIYLNRNRRIAKAYIRLPYLIVNGNQSGFDGYSIGLNGFENVYRDQETEYIVKNLEKGVRIKIDENGNLIFRKMCQLSVQVKDWLQQLTVDGSGSLSDDIIALHGMCYQQLFLKEKTNIYIFLQVKYLLINQSKCLI